MMRLSNRRNIRASAVAPLSITKVTATKLAIILCTLLSIASLSSTLQKLRSFEEKKTIFLPPIIVPPSVDDDVRIVHVISPFVVDNCDARFCPVDQTQSLVVGSMLRAVGKSRGPVLLAAAFLPDDAAAAPPDLIRLPLTRSTATEYTNTTKALPFIQDIFDGLRKSGMHYDYVIYTNADIILHEDFYNIVRKQIRAGYDSFQINRQTVTGSSRNRQGDPYTVQDLDEIFASQELQLHPGTDCFVIKKNILEKVDMGNLFLGTPPFGSMLLVQTSHFAERSRKFESFELNATYHLGNDFQWRKSEALIRLTKQNVNNVVAEHGSWIDLCAEEMTNKKDTGREHFVQYCEHLRRKLKKFGGISPRSTCESSNNCGNRTDTTTSGVRFIFSLGVEGTGHAFLSEVSAVSPLAVAMAETGLLELQTEIASLLRQLIYFKCELSSRSHRRKKFKVAESVFLNPIMDELVTKLRRLEGEVQAQVLPILQRINPKMETVSINLNLPEGGADSLSTAFTPFPTGKDECQYVAQPDLGIIYRACNEAGVRCGHVVLVREAYQVLSETAARVDARPMVQITMLAKMIKEISAEILEFPDRLVGCFDYDAPTAQMEEWATDNLFGWTIPDGSLKIAFNYMYEPSTGSKIERSRYNGLQMDRSMYAGFELYFDVLDRSMQFLRDLCTRQLRGGAPGSVLAGGAADILLPLPAVVTAGHAVDAHASDATDIKFVFALGIEGTGHHFLSSLYQSSPMAQIMETTGVIELQVQVAKLVRILLIFRCTTFSDYEPEWDLNQTYAELVEKLGLLEKEVRSKVVPLLGDTRGGITINLNGVLSKEDTDRDEWAVVTSFPAGKGECRHVIQFDLGILYRACTDAGTACGHLLMTRDAHEVVRSTVSLRKFMFPTMQVAVLAKVLKEMLAEAYRFSERLVGCFDYNAPTAGMGGWGESLFGHAVPDGSLKRAMDRLYRAPTAVSPHEEAIIPPGFELYMDVMVQATQRLRTLCGEQVKTRGTTSSSSFI